MFYSNKVNSAKHPTTQPSNTEHAAPNLLAANPRLASVSPTPEQSLPVELQTPDQPGSQLGAANQASSPHYADPTAVQEPPAAAVSPPAEAALEADLLLQADGQSQSGEQVLFSIHLESSYDDDDDDDGIEEDVSAL